MESGKWEFHSCWSRLKAKYFFVYFPLSYDYPEYTWSVGLSFMLLNLFYLDSKSESSEEEESEAETENPSKSTTSADNTTSQDTSDTNPANDDSEKSKTVEQETKTYEEKKGLTLVFYQWLLKYGLALIFCTFF